MKTRSSWNKGEKFWDLVVLEGGNVKITWRLIDHLQQRCCCWLHVGNAVCLQPPTHHPLQLLQWNHNDQKQNSWQLDKYNRLNDTRKQPMTIERGFNDRLVIQFKDEQSKSICIYHNYNELEAFCIHPILFSHDLISKESKLLFCVKDQIDGSIRYKFRIKFPTAEMLHSFCSAVAGYVTIKTYEEWAPNRNMNTSGNSSDLMNLSICSDHSTISDLSSTAGGNSSRTKLLPSQALRELNGGGRKQQQIDDGNGTGGINILDITNCHQRSAGGQRIPSPRISPVPGHSRSKEDLIGKRNIERNTIPILVDACTQTDGIAFGIEKNNSNEANATNGINLSTKSDAGQINVNISNLISVEAVRELGQILVDAVNLAMQNNDLYCLTIPNQMLDEKPLFWPFNIVTKKKKKAKEEENAERWRRFVEAVNQVCPKKEEAPRPFHRSSSFESITPTQLATKNIVGRLRHLYLLCTDPEQFHQFIEELPFYLVSIYEQLGIEIPTELEPFKPQESNPQKNGRPNRIDLREYKNKRMDKLEHFLMKIEKFDDETENWEEEKENVKKGKKKGTRNSESMKKEQLTLAPKKPQIQSRTFQMGRRFGNGKSRFARFGGNSAPKKIIDPPAGISALSQKMKIGKELEKRRIRAYVPETPEKKINLEREKNKNGENEIVEQTPLHKIITNNSSLARKLAELLIREEMRQMSELKEEILEENLVEFTSFAIDDLKENDNKNSSILLNKISERPKQCAENSSNADILSRKRPFTPSDFNSSSSVVDLLQIKEKSAKRPCRRIFPSSRCSTISSTTAAGGTADFPFTRRQS